MIKVGQTYSYKDQDLDGDFKIVNIRNDKADVQWIKMRKKGITSELTNGYITYYYICSIDNWIKCGSLKQINIDSELVCKKK